MSAPLHDETPGLSREEVLRQIARRGDELREVLAKSPDSDPRVLAFLAAEGTRAAKRAVAANPSASAATNRLLAESDDEEVRAELAAKLGRLMPGLASEAQSEVMALTIETLEILAEDELPRIRAILAEGIKRLDCVPHHIITRLACDLEEVSAPILEYSPLLSDADLIDIVTTAGARYALVAIARRQPLAADVCDALVAVKDVPAVAVLLANPDADIRSRTLEKLAEDSRMLASLQEPLSLRAGLSPRAIRRIAGFAGSALIEKLAERHDLSDEMRRYLRQQLTSRLKAEEKGQPNLDLSDRELIEAVRDGQREAVITALATGAGISTALVERVLDSRQAKAVTSLVWRAGFSMRAAFRIQTDLLHLPAPQLLPAREGVKFPLSEADMRWQLQWYGIHA